MNKRWAYLLPLAVPFLLYKQIDSLYSTYYWEYSIHLWPISCVIMLLEILVLYLSILGLFRRSGLDVSQYVAIPLGLLLFGTISFLLGFISSLPFVRLFSFMLIPLIFLAIRKGGEISKKDLLPFLYFLLVFIPILLLRAGIPSAYYNYGEALMDLAFLSASIRTPSLPMYDPWLSGFVANYYYFGHFLWGSLSMLSFMPPEYCVNYGAALTLAMVFSASYGFLRKMKVGKWTSLLGSFFITFSGTPYTFFWIVTYILHGSLPNLAHPWKYFNVFWHLAPAYMIPGATVHTPAIDFLQREFHENFIVIPYLISYISLIAEIRRERKGFFWIVPFLGAFFPMDSWVLPIATLFTWLTLGVISIPWTFLSLIFYLPYYFSLQYKPGLGFIPPGCSAIPSVPIWAFATFFSLQLLVIFGYLFLKRKDRKSLIALIFAGVAGVAFYFTRYHPLLLALPLLVYFGIKRDEERIPRFLIFVSILFIVFCEFFYVKDIYSLYGPSQYSRFNTIFKIYEPCWIMLSLSSFVLLVRGFDSLKKNRKKIFRGVFAASVVLALISLSYFPAAYLGDKYAPYCFDAIDKGRFGLNSVEYLSNLDGMYFLRKMPPGVILEGVGKSPGYSYSPFGRVSAVTGMPEVLGWGGHEETWRGMKPQIIKEVSDRYYAILSFYLDPSEQKLKELYQEYHVKYVFFGELEEKMIEEHQGSPQYSLHELEEISGLKCIYSGHNCYVFEVLPSKLSSGTRPG